MSSISYIPEYEVERKTKIRNLYNQEPYLTRNTMWERDKNTRKHNTQESQEVNHFTAGDNVAARNRQDSKTKIKMTHIITKYIPQKKHRHWTVSKQSLEDLNMFYGIRTKTNKAHDVVQRAVIHLHN